MSWSLQTIQRISSMHCAFAENCTYEGANQSPFEPNEEVEITMGKVP